MLSRGASTPLSLRSSDWILLFGSIPEIVAKLAVAAFRRFEFYHPIAQAVCMQIAVQYFSGGGGITRVFTFAI